MSTNIERLISEIKTLSPEQKLELARRLDEEDIFYDDQSWYWIPEWQAAEKEADADFSLGRIHHYDNADDLMRSLHARRKQAREKCDL